MSGANSPNGIAWLYIRGLTLSCGQQDSEFTSWHGANMIISSSRLEASELLYSLLQVPFCFKPVDFNTLDYGSLRRSKQ